MGGPGVFGPPKDHDEAIRVLRRAVEAGVDHLDTSQYYGPDVVNALIREALHPYDGLTLVSKVGARRDDTGGWLPWDRPQDLRQGIEDNLRPLGVEQLGAVNLRLMTGEHLEGQLDAMIQAREEGLIAGLGLSNVTLGQVALAWTLAQSPSVLLIPGTSSVAHLEQNLLAAELEPPELP